MFQVDIFAHVFLLSSNRFQERFRRLLSIFSFSLVSFPILTYGTQFSSGFPYRISNKSPEKDKNKEETRREIHPERPRLLGQRAGKHSSETSLKYDKLSNSTGKNTFHALPAQATTISSPLLSLARARVSRSGHSCFFFGRRREEAKCRTEISPENGRQNTK